MAKLIAVSKSKLARANRKLERLLERDPAWQAEKMKIEEAVNAENKRRDQEHAARG